MHSQARAFLQPTRANIHQYQFNNPIILEEPYCYHALTLSARCPGVKKINVQKKYINLDMFTQN